MEAALQTAVPNQGPTIEAHPANHTPDISIVQPDESSQASEPINLDELIEFSNQLIEPEPTEAELAKIRAKTIAEARAKRQSLLNEQAASLRKALTDEAVPPHIVDALIDTFHMEMAESICLSEVQLELEERYNLLSSRLGRYITQEQYKQALAYEEVPLPIAKGSLELALKVLNKTIFEQGHRIEDGHNPDWGLSLTPKEMPLPCSYLSTVKAMNRCQREMLHYTARVHSIVKTMEHNQRLAPITLDGLRPLLNRLGYTLNSVDEATNTLTVTTPYIVANYEGEHYRMGRYKLIVSGTNGVRCVGTSTVHKVDGYIHPHINGSGQVCWGSATEAMAYYNKSGDPTQILEALPMVLSNITSSWYYNIDGWKSRLI